MDPNTMRNIREAIHTINGATADIDVALGHLQCYSRFGTTLPSDVMGYAIQLRSFSRCLMPSMQIAKQMEEAAAILDQIVIQRQPGLLMTPGRPNVPLSAPVPQRPPPPGIPAPTVQIPIAPNAVTNQRPIFQQPMASNQLLMLQHLQAALLANGQQLQIEPTSVQSQVMTTAVNQTTTTTTLPTFVNRPAPGGKILIPISSETVTQSTVPYQMHTVLTQPSNSSVQQQQNVISVSDAENAAPRDTMPRYSPVSPVSSPCSCGGDDDDQESDDDAGQPQNITEAVEKANQVEAEKRLRELIRQRKANENARQVSETNTHTKSSSKPSSRTSSHSREPLPSSDQRRSSHSSFQERGPQATATVTVEGGTPFIPPRAVSQQPMPKKKPTVQAQLVYMTGPPPLSVTSSSNSTKKKNTPTKKKTNSKASANGGDQPKRSSSQKRPVSDDVTVAISDQSGDENLSCSQSSDSSAKRQRNAKSQAGGKIRESLTPRPLPDAEPYEYDLKIHHKGGKNRKRNEAAKEMEARRIDPAAHESPIQSTLDF